MKLSINQQVCTLEQAKKLALLGVNQLNSIFYFFREDCEAADDFRIVYAPEGLILKAAIKSEKYSAFNVMELGHMILECELVGESYYSSHLGCWLWQMLDHDEDGDFPFKVVHTGGGEFETEAEARADMLIFCLESKLISVPGVNEQLT
jgi:hypothetical protein